MSGVLSITHPFPSFMNGLTAAIFYMLALGDWTPPGLVALFLSVLLTHAAIGSVNDYCDIDLDRRTKPAKPIVAGIIAPRGALAVAAVSALVALALAAWFGPGTLAIAILVLAAGMAYDLWLKGTVWSWLPFGLAIPALPVWSFVAAERFDPLLLLSFPLGLLIAMALNLANSIPDLDGDAAYGVEGFAHRLGEHRALRIAWGAFAVSIGLLGLSPIVIGNDAGALLPGLALGIVLLGGMVCDNLIHRSAASLRRNWYGSAVLAAVIGLTWVVSLPLEP